MRNLSDLECSIRFMLNDDTIIETDIYVTSCPISNNGHIQVLAVRVGLADAFRPCTRPGCRPIKYLTVLKIVIRHSGYYRTVIREKDIHVLASAVCHDPHQQTLVVVPLFTDPRRQQPRLRLIGILYHAAREIPICPAAHDGPVMRKQDVQVPFTAFAWLTALSSMTMWHLRNPTGLHLPQSHGQRKTSENGAKRAADKPRTVRLYDARCLSLSTARDLIGPNRLIREGGARWRIRSDGSPSLMPCSRHGASLTPRFPGLGAAAPAPVAAWRGRDLSSHGHPLVEAFLYSVLCLNCVTNVLRNQEKYARYSNKLATPRAERAGPGIDRARGRHLWNHRRHPD